MRVEKISGLYIVLTDEGKYLTDYKNGEDIINFHSTKTFYIKNENDVKRIREITKEENEKYLREKIKKLKLLKETQGE